MPTALPGPATASAYLRPGPRRALRPAQQPAATAAVTNAVVAIWVVLLPAVAVGAVGVPVKSGDADNTTLPEPVAEVTPVPPLAIDKDPLNEVAVTAPHDGALDPFDIKTCPEVPAAV